MHAHIRLLHNLHGCIAMLFPYIRTIHFIVLTIAITKLHSYTCVFAFLFVEIFIILPYILGSNLLLCSNDNLVVAAQESTVFCEIQGCMNFIYHSYVGKFLK